jgi:hypothetical protein
MLAPPTAASAAAEADDDDDAPDLRSPQRPRLRSALAAPAHAPVAGLVVRSAADLALAARRRPAR